MMSNKWTFSLTSLITILLLTFVATPAMAATGGPTVTISGKDHSADDGKQVIPAAGADTTFGNADDTVVVTVAFGDPVNWTYTQGTPLTEGTPGNFEPDLDVMFIGTNNDDVEQATAPTATNWVQKNSKTFEGTIQRGDAATTKIRIYIRADVAKSVGGVTLGRGNQASNSYEFSLINADPGDPYPVRMTRLPPASGFMSDKVSGAFEVKIVLSEKPKEGKFTAAHLGIANGSVGAVVSGGSISRADYVTMDKDGVLAAYDSDDNDIRADDGTVQSGHATLNPLATGGDGNFYRYRATITPDFKKDKVIVWVTDFVDNALDPAKKYTLVTVNKVPDDLADGKAKLEVSVDLTGVDKPTAAAGVSVGIPNDTIIPAGGYLVVVRDDGDGANEAEKSSESLIIHPGDRKNANLAGSGRSLIKQQYNVVPVDLIYDLEGFLIRGGTIDLIAPDAGVKISEIMWGTDGGDNNRQWIEIHNTGSTQLKTKDYKFMLYTANEAFPDMADATKKVVDRVSTLYKGTNHWPIAGKGQSGRTAGLIVEEKEVEVDGTTDVEIDIAIVPTDRLISMERAMSGGMYADGTMASSWAQSQQPSSNFVDAAGGLFVGSPGADPINPVADPVPAPEPMAVPVAMAADIMITEIMVDTANGRLPQWIELTNVSGAEKSLAGWSVEIENAAADADVIASSISINLSGTLGVGGGMNAGGTMGKSLLLVAWGGRSSSNLGTLGDRLMNVSGQLKQRGRYTLLSPMGFMIELLPPQTTGIVQFGDAAGNLGADAAWDIPMDDSGRSSLIRHEMVAGMATMGTDANGWVLASSTSLVSGPATWYGSDEDAGTPGYDAGGPLPVELSHFRPARDKATGAVVITWATQSELNNAGFFIKRSNQRDGEFQVINATMVPGAGTTSEKQFYTYTDTTAQPNIVYYYQIEDVSLDGQRQTLTRGIRLKGHVGAAGKATTTWGALKTSHE